MKKKNANFVFTCWDRERDRQRQREREKHTYNSQKVQINKSTTTWENCIDVLLTSERKKETQMRNARANFEIIQVCKQQSLFYACRRMKHNVPSYF